jgi:hypothetical protein
MLGAVSLVKKIASGLLVWGLFVGLREGGLVTLDWPWSTTPSFTRSAGAFEEKLGEPLTSCRVDAPDTAVGRAIEEAVGCKKADTKPQVIISVTNLSPDPFCYTPLYMRGDAKYEVQAHAGNRLVFSYPEKRGLTIIGIYSCRSFKAKLGELIGAEIKRNLDNAAAK